MTDIQGFGRTNARKTKGPVLIDGMGNRVNWWSIGFAAAKGMFQGALVMVPLVWYLLTYHREEMAPLVRRFMALIGLS